MRRPEQALQQTVARFLSATFPNLLWFHVPNSSGNRGAQLGAIMKSMGVKAGVPDLVLILPNGIAGFIELKAKRGKLTEAQAAFRDRALAMGCLWSEARSVEDVQTILYAWFTPFGWTLRATVAA